MLGSVPMGRGRAVGGPITKGNSASAEPACDTGVLGAHGPGPIWTRDLRPHGRSGPWGSETVGSEVRRNGGAWRKKGPSLCREDGSVQGLLERDLGPEDFWGGGGVSVTGTMGGCSVGPVAWSRQPPRHISAGRELCAPRGGMGSGGEHQEQGSRGWSGESTESGAAPPHCRGSQFSPQGL